MKNFYCQLDYPNLPYAFRGDGRTIADCGCGVCCASMLIEGMFKEPFSLSFPPEEAAEFAQYCGARDRFGTNFYILGSALAGRFDLKMTCTEDLDEVLALMRADPFAKTVANTRGDREGYVGLFSDSGHYILLDRLQDGQFCVLDPMYRPGRYDIPGRAGKVRMEGCAAWCDCELLRPDCFERPYFVFQIK